MDWEAFFTVHSDLPREGPGEAADVAWALALGSVPEGAVICDAGAGSGGDGAALLAGHLDAVIAQNPGHLARSALRVLRAKADRQAIDEGQEQLRIEVVIRENLPVEPGEAVRASAA